MLKLSLFFLLTSMLAVCIFTGCEHSILDIRTKDKQHIECTGVVASGPFEVKLYFSEILSENNTDVSRFEVFNSSTGKIIDIITAKPAGQTITLGLEQPNKSAPHVLVAGHVFDVVYHAYARDNDAQADGTRRFTADFIPPVPSEPQVWKDSVGTVMVLWSPDNRVGNTGQKLWKRQNTTRQMPKTLAAELAPDVGIFWSTLSQEYGNEFSLNAYNKYGDSEKTAWKSIVNARIKAFVCKDVCLTSLTWSDLPKDFTRRENRSSCSRVEYYNSETESALVREFSPSGIVQTSITADSTSIDSTFDWCR